MFTALGSPKGASIGCALIVFIQTKPASIAVATRSARLPSAVQTLAARP